MAVLGLRFCARAFSSCGKWGPIFIAVRGPLTIAASLVAEHRLQTRRLSSCGSRAQLLRGMWDLPRPGHEPLSPALAGRLSTTAPPGKSQDLRRCGHPNDLQFHCRCEQVYLQFALISRLQDRYHTKHGTVQWSHLLAASTFYLLPSYPLSHQRC